MEGKWRSNPKIGESFGFFVFVCNIKVIHLSYIPV